MQTLFRKAPEPSSFPPFLLWDCSATHRPTEPPTHRLIDTTEEYIPNKILTLCRKHTWHDKHPSGLWGRTRRARFHCRTSAFRLPPFTHLSGLFPLFRPFLGEWQVLGKNKPPDCLEEELWDTSAAFVILHIALSVCGLTEAYLRGRTGLLLTLNGSRKRLATRLADEDITA